MRACVLVCLLFVAFASCDWQIVDSDFATIAIATSFTDPETGYIAGGTAGLAPLLLHTTDGGVNLQNEGLYNETVGAFLSVRMGSSSWGVAGGFGFLGLPCGAYTNDGYTWYEMEEGKFFFICAFQGAAAVDDGKTGVLVGVFSDRRDWQGDGIKITTDGGQNWSQYNSQTGTVPARYASFLSKDMGYVTGGTFPSTTDLSSIAPEMVTEYAINSLFSWNLLEKKFHYNKRQEEHRVVTGYSAVLSAVTNEGKDWKLMVNETASGLYFNEISCTDTNNCWAVLAGIDSVGNDTSKIYHTSDGWSTYNTQLEVPGGYLTCIDMSSSTTGWAGGALIQGDISGSFDGIFYQTTDGINWTPSNQLKNFFPQDISVAGPNNVYSAGITPIGLSSFASYTN